MLYVQPATTRAAPRLAVCGLLSPVTGDPPCLPEMSSRFWVCMHSLFMRRTHRLPYLRDSYGKYANCVSCHWPLPEMAGLALK